MHAELVNGRIQPPFRPSKRRMLSIETLLRETWARHASTPGTTVFASVKTMDVFDDMVTNWDTVWWPRIRAEKAEKRRRAQRRRRMVKGRLRW